MVESNNFWVNSLNEYNVAWTERKSSTVTEAVWCKAWETFEVVRNKEEKMRGGGGGTSEGDCGGGGGGVTKKSKPLLWTLPWSSRGRAIRTESHAGSECGGVGRGEQWSEDWRLSAPQSKREAEAESQGQRAGVQNVCFSPGEWMMGRLQLHFLLHWMIFNWILLPSSQHLNTGLFAVYQPLCAQLLYGSWERKCR